MTPDPADELRAVLERLEATTTELSGGEPSAERSRQLADEAMRLSGQIAALLPRVLRSPDA